MDYNCTLLKELPDYPVGTTFKVRVKDNKTIILNSFKDQLNKRAVYIAESVINNPDWVKKELDETCLTELKCKSCGSAKMLLEARHAPYKYDDGVYFYRMKVIGICTCGYENEFIEFTTHTKVHY